MNKISSLLILTTLLAGGTSYAQNQPAMFGSGKAVNSKTFFKKPATIKGASTEVTYGGLPTIEIQREIDSNTAIPFENKEYYYNEGDFFMYNGGRYILIAPPIGLTIENISDDAVLLEQVAPDIYYQNGIFFKKIKGRFEVIKEQLGAIIYNLPPNTAVVTIGEKAYYEYLGVLYEKVLVNKEEGFVVVGELIK